MHENSTTKVLSLLKNKAVKRLLKKSLSTVLIPLVLMMNVPVAALALPAGPTPPVVPTFAQNPKSVRMGPRTLSPVRADFRLSTNPSDLELSTARVFDEPLVFMSWSSVPGENEALAHAISEFRKTKNIENISDFKTFLKDFPKSRWAPAVQLNIGKLLFSSGFLSEARELWTSAWVSSKSETGIAQKAIADRAIAELLMLEARLGMMTEIESHLSEINARPFQGTTEQLISAARESLSGMRNRSDKAFKCGPYSINQLLSLKNGKEQLDKRIDEYASTKEGTSLLQLKQLSDKVELKYQIAKRSKGAEIIVPSVFHWTLNHFGCISKKVGDKFEVKDPTFGRGGTLLLSKQAIDAETDGYALIPQGSLPSGWTSVTDEEAARIFGKGYPFLYPDNDPGPPSAPPGCSVGMARCSVSTTAANLNVVDSPLTYECPIGGTKAFTAAFNYRQANQPVTYNFTNLGMNWSFNHLSYLSLDVSSTATVRLGDGRSEIYTLSGGVYPRNRMSMALLVNLGGGVFERQLTDGSVERYDLSDGGTPAKIFMTKSLDPQGNATLIQYDANFRITGIIDPIGEISTLTYVSNTLGNSGFYKVAQISDPFSRTCGFSYDSTNTNLLTITDVISLQSKFVYDSGSSFINAVSTPYGTTSFTSYVPTTLASSRGIRTIYPDGSNDVVETWLGHEPLDATFYWDREALDRYPNDPGNHDFTHCKKTAWLWNPTDMSLYPMVDYLKPALENRTSFAYTDEGISNNRGYIGAGTINRPISMTRAVGTPIKATLGGTKTTGDILTLTFTDAALPGGAQSVSYTALAGDNLSSIAKGLATAVNADARLKALGVTAAATSTSIAMVSQSTNATVYTKSLSGGATETISLATAYPQSSQFTVTGTGTAGQYIQLYLNVQGSFADFVQYNPTTGETPTSMATGLKNLVNARASFIAQGISANSVGSQLFVSTSTTPNNITYTPSFFGTQGLTQDYQTTGSAIASTFQYNLLGKKTLSVDPVGRVMAYTYAANGIDLTQVTEVQNGDSFMLGNWTYNTKHRPTQHIDGSARQWNYTYNSSGQIISMTDPNSNSTTMTYSGTSSATVGGTKTTGDVLTITVFDAGLSGGQKAISYTTLAPDTLTTIATALKNAINADVSLQGIGVSATSAATVINLTSNSVNATTYTKTLSGGATETITLGANRFGYLTKTDGPLSGSNDKTTFSYDGFNRLATTTDSVGYALSYGYDNADRRVLTTYPDATTETTIYDKLDAIFSKDRNGRWNQSGYDSLDQLTFELDPLGRRTQYEWCDCGSLAKLIDPAGNVTSWHHDLQGRKIQKVYADRTTVNYAYETGAGRMLSRTDALNQTTNYFLNPDGTTFGTGYQNAVNPTSSVINSYDSKFSRISSVKNDWGTIAYSYNPYVTGPGATPTTGGGKLATVTNDVIANSDISYVYDFLGRTTNRSINGASNSITWSYDAMSRVTSEANALGTFNYAYVDDTPGASKGITRLASVGYPNSQTTNYDWYGNSGDQRLKQIKNLNPSGGTLSQFDYGYNPAGEITQWQQQQNGGNDFHNFSYDLAGQLVADQVGSGAPQAPFSKEFYYNYDSAANRTGVQSHSVDTLRIGGTVTTGNVLTVTVKDLALAGGQQAISYTAVGGDTLSTMAQNLATNINLNTNLQAIGVVANAQAGKNFINIRAASSNITTYSASTSGGATATMTFGIWKNGLWNAVIGGTKTTGNVLTITVKDIALAGGSKAINYTVLAGDTLTTMTTGMKNAINADAALIALGVTATSVGTAISIASNSTNVTTYAQSVSGGATATISLSINQNSLQTATLAGTVTTGNTITVQVYNSALAGGTQAVTYTTIGGDTLTSIATGLTTAINGNANLQAVATSATSSGNVITLQSKSVNLTTYRGLTSSLATTTVTLSVPVNSWTVAAIGGTKTTGNVLSITAYDAALASGSKVVNYTVLAGDNLTTIAAGIAAAVNADVSLQAIGVTAISSSTVVSLKSTSPNLTTYAQSVSAGTTATIALSSSTSVVNSTVNNVNALVAIAPGGKAKFQGSTSKPVRSAAVSGQVVTLSQQALNSVDFESSVAGVPTETLTFGPNQDGNITATIGGTITPGDVLSITVNDIRFNYGPVTTSYAVKSGDTTSTVASAIATAMFAKMGNGSGAVYPYPYFPAAVGSVITINPNFLFAINTYSKSVTGVPTETVTYSANTNGNATATIGGTATANDVVSLTIVNSDLTGGRKNVSYSVAAGNTPTNIATGLKNAINADVNLQAIGVTATSTAAVVSISTAGTTYTTATSGGATVTLTQGTNANGNASIAVGGKATSGNTATITAFNPKLPGGQQAITYNVGASDTLVNIAAGLASAINANANLQTLAVSAKNSEAADLAFSQSFSGNSTLPAGASLANVSATDAVPTTKTNTNTLAVTSSASSTLTWDANGNMTSDGTNSYKWDAENRLIEIDYPGSSTRGRQYEWT